MPVSQSRTQLHGPVTCSDGYACDNVCSGDNDLKTDDTDDENGDGDVQ